MAVGGAHVSWLSFTSTDTTFLSKATIKPPEESLPQPGIKPQPRGHDSDMLTTGKSWKTKLRAFV